MCIRDRNSTRKVLIGFAGWAVLLLGVVMIPYPGPGWAVVFVGLSILATEYAWASDVHQYARGKYDAWLRWMKVQPLYIRMISGSYTHLDVYKRQHLQRV